MLTADLISSKEHTLFAGAVPSAVVLAFMITSITYFKVKDPAKPRYFPKVFLMALQHGIFAFGAVTIFAILLQRYFGSISVTPIVSVIIVGIISGLVGGTVDYMTKKNLRSINR